MGYVLLDDPIQAVTSTGQIHRLRAGIGPCRWWNVVRGAGGRRSFRSRATRSGRGSSRPFAGDSIDTGVIIILRGRIKEGGRLDGGRILPKKGAIGG